VPAASSANLRAGCDPPAWQSGVGRTTLVPSTTADGTAAPTVASTTPTAGKKRVKTFRTR